MLGGLRAKGTPSLPGVQLLRPLCQVVLRECTDYSYRHTIPGPANPLLGIFPAHLLVL